MSKPTNILENRKKLPLMIPAKDPPFKHERLKDLDSYNILDTLPEQDYDNITTLASQICDTDISMVTLIDDKRQWFKSTVGINVKETPKELAFCTHAILNPMEIFIVQDARKDERFHDNPFVSPEPLVVFYAGVPLVSSSGYALGTLCVIDHKPKILSKNQLNSLKALAKQVMNLLELRKQLHVNEATINQLHDQNNTLEQFASIAAHDIKSPLNNIIGLSKLLSTQVEDKHLQVVQNITNSAHNLKNMVSSLLDYSLTSQVIKEQNSTLKIEDIKDTLIGLYSFDHAFQFQIHCTEEEITTNQSLLYRVLSNLLWNAIRYSDQSVPAISLSIEKRATDILFSFWDDGPGIDNTLGDTIFQIFKTGKALDRYGNPGHGIGLASVRKMIEEAHGSIEVDWDNNEGAKFIFILPI